MLAVQCAVASDPRCLHLSAEACEEISSSTDIRRVQSAYIVMSDTKLYLKPCDISCLDMLMPHHAAAVQNSITTDARDIRKQILWERFATENRVCDGTFTSCLPAL